MSASDAAVYAIGTLFLAWVPFVTWGAGLWPKSRRDQ